MYIKVRKEDILNTLCTAIELHPHAYVIIPSHWSKTDVTRLNWWV